MKPVNEKEADVAPTTLTKPALHHPDLRPRWLAIVAIVFIGIIYALLPSNLRVIEPNWLLLVIEAALILPLLLIHRRLTHTTIRLFILILLGIVTLALAAGVTLLIVTLPKNSQGLSLLRSAVLLWIFNILVFALWYFEIDGNGPYQRPLSKHKAADFMFPQQADGNTNGWAPLFIDYLFLAFTGATALSPADTFPLTRKAKVLMMLEAIFSMAIIVLLAARAVNILTS
jgi:uncharacterized membrane protein